MSRNDYNLGEFSPYVVAFHNTVGILDIRLPGDYQDVKKDKKYQRAILVQSLDLEERFSQDMPEIWKLVYTALTHTDLDILKLLPGAVFTFSFETYMQQSAASW